MSFKIVEPRIAFFHGLDSEYPSDKTIYIQDNYRYHYTPHMDYRNDDNLFEKTYQALLEFKPDLIIGNSMGGWFSYSLSTLLNVPTLLLNPAVQGRSIAVIKDVVTRQGDFRPKSMCVFGINDDVINPYKSIDYLKAHQSLENMVFYIGDFGHRLDAEAFDRYSKLAIHNLLQP